MDNETFEQVEIPKSITGEQYKLLKEKLRGNYFIYGRKTNFIGLPNNIGMYY